MDVCVQVHRLTYLFTCLTAGRATLASKFEEPRAWTLYILQSNTSSAGMESGRVVTTIFQFQTIRNTNYDIPLPQMHHSKHTIAALSHTNTTNAAYCSQPSHWRPKYVKNFMYPHYQLQNKNTTFCPQSAFVCFVWCSEQRMIISLHYTNRTGVCTLYGKNRILKYNSGYTQS